VCGQKNSDTDKSLPGRVRLTVFGDVFRKATSSAWLPNGKNNAEFGNGQTLLKNKSSEPAFLNYKLFQDLFQSIN